MRVSRTLRWNSEIQIRKRFGVPVVLSALSNICFEVPHEILSFVSPKSLCFTAVNKKSTKENCRLSED